MFAKRSIFLLFAIIIGIEATTIPLEKDVETTPEATNTITSGPVSETCLKCICDAVTGCSRNYGYNGYTSGPFRITKPFWVEAGKPTLKGGDPESPTAFETCTTDYDCAVETVQSFMKKYERDCDSNGIIDCYDYGAIHLLGRHNCAAPMPGTYTQAYNDCKEPDEIAKV